MKNKARIQNFPSRFFVCPASDYLNQHNETGSHGQLSYQFLKHLSMKSSVKNIFATVMMSVPVTPIPKTKIDVIVRKRGQRSSLNDFDSLYFYLKSFISFFRRNEYRQAVIIHHIIPFKFGR